MNKKFLIIALCVVVAGVAAGLYFFSKGSSKHLRLVPADAAFVATIDLKTLADKAQADGKLKETKVFKMLSKDEKTDGMAKLFTEIMKHPLNCGLNVFSKMYIYTQTGQGSNYNTGFVADVKDADKFAEFIKGIPELAKSVSQKTGYRLLNIDGDMLAWNEHGLLVLETGGVYEPEAKQAANLKGYDKIMNQDKKASMADHKEFSRHPGKQDIDFFLNYGEFMKSSAAMSNPLLANMAKNYKDVYMTGGLTFENDKISFSGKIHGDEKNIEKITYTKTKGVKDEAMQYVTNDKVHILMSVNLDMPKLINMFTSDQGIRQNLEQTAQGMGLTLKELESVFSGEIVIALADVADKTVKSYDYVMNEATGEMEMVQGMTVQPMPVLTVNLGVGNKDAYNKLMKNLPVPVLEGVRTYPLPMLSSMAYQVENDYGVSLTNDSTWASTLAMNKKYKGKPASDISKLATSNPGAFFMDLNIDHYSPSLKNFMSRNMGDKDFGDFKSFMSLFVDVRGSADTRESKIEVNMIKGEGNSLYRLLKQCDYLPLD